MLRILKIIKKIIHLHVKAGLNLVNHDGVEHAGYMAFITLLAFFPFLIFLMAVTGFIGNLEHGKELIFLLINNMPADLIQAIKPRVDEIMRVPPNSLLTVSILGIIWTSSSTVEGIRTILNRIHHHATPPAYIWRRLLSILQFFIIIAILIASMFILLFLPIIYERIEHLDHLKPLLHLLNQLNTMIIAPVWESLRYITFILTMFAGVMLLYYVIPNVSFRIRSLIPGALEVAILWMVSGYLLSKYIYVFTQLNFVYGSLAGFIITLLFFYIIHIIFIYGAEINKLLLKSKNINEINSKNIS
ncbi:MAG: YihY/virulence factor BrkB family protein [Pseudomonadota bacterium]